MSKLRGYDSDAVGFDSVSQNKRAESQTSSQTLFTESSTGCQTNFSKNAGCSTEKKEVATPKDYPPKGLNEFLRRVVPSMLEQLDQNEKEFQYNSSDSEEEDAIMSKLFQELRVNLDMPGFGGGDFQASVLGISWSCAGNSLAVSIGQLQHESWCEHDGLIRIYTVKRSEQDKLVHTLDISEKNCITTLKYHPNVSALLAYGTTSGEVVLCNLRNSMLEDGMQLSTPAGCHGSKKVSALSWADVGLTNMFLTAQIAKTGKRRGASDQILISAGSDGTINVWQVNANLRIFESVICYNINSSKKTPSPDITCFDFIKTYPLRPCEEKVPDDIFVVGTKSGKLYLCKVKAEFMKEMVDPVYDELEGHPTCVLDLAFSFQKPGIFASISMDSEVRLYDVNQSCPIRVLCLDVPITSMCWLPNNPCVVALGLCKPEGQQLRLYNLSSGRLLPFGGFDGNDTVCSLAITQSGSTRIASGDTMGTVRVWDLPTRRIRLSAEDLEF